jgi:hypothetical protein
MRISECELAFPGVLAVTPRTYPLFCACLVEISRTAPRSSSRHVALGHSTQGDVASEVAMLTRCMHLEVLQYIMVEPALEVAYTDKMLKRRETHEQSVRHRGAALLHLRK